MVLLLKFSNSVPETIWADFVLKNPLQVDVELTDLTVVVKEAGETQSDEAQTGLVEVEVIDKISLAPGEQRTVCVFLVSLFPVVVVHSRIRHKIPVSIKSLRPTKLILTQLTYEFFASIPCTESLGTRGRRLNDTIAQRQDKTYAPDVFVEVETEECRQRLDASFVEDSLVALIQGERKRLEVWINNTGVEDVSEVWMVSGPENVVWIGTPASEELEGETLTVELSETNLPVRLERGGFPVIEQCLESCAIADTDRGLHWFCDTET